MTITAAQIRKRLLACYPPQEASNLTRIICCEFLEQSTVDYYLGKDIILSANSSQELEAKLSRLEHFEPMQYVQGFARFLGRSFQVAPGVLIPRPETEELVERMLQEVPADARILDIGTGSGCIALSLALELPATTVTAWDVSDDALRIAQNNAQALGASVTFERQDILTYTPNTETRFDVMVSNPPYITHSEEREMERNVLDWEPSLALFVPDNDPLLFYRRIATLGREMLTPGGSLYFEINRAYGQATVSLLEELGYQEIHLYQDISKNDRMISAIRG